MTNSVTGETRTIALNLANALISHPCQLNPESGITECTDPRHDDDSRALREQLEMVGIVPTLAAASTRARVRTGKCPECEYVHNLTQAGLLNRHRIDRESGPYCSGERREPVSDDHAA